MHHVLAEQLGFNEIDCAQWDRARAVIFIASVPSWDGELLHDVATRVACTPAGDSAEELM